MRLRLRWPGLKRSAPSLPSPARRAPSRQAGFSLIELLTVIAIIAILAAVIFPVAGVVRARAQQTQVISNLKSIHQALNAYKLDEHGFPPTLGPLVINGGGSTLTYNGLFPEYMRDQKAYGSPASDVENPNEAYPINPNASGGPYGAYGNLSGIPPTVNDPAIKLGQQAAMYGWNTMDGHVGPDGKYVMHYTRFRTFDRNDPDFKRQLGFRNPPEDTVVTWNDTFVRKDASGQPIGGEYLVLFLNGTVKKFNLKQVEAVGKQIWRLQP